MKQALLFLPAGLAIGVALGVGLRLPAYLSQASPPPTEKRTLYHVNKKDHVVENPDTGRFEDSSDSSTSEAKIESLAFAHLSGQASPQPQVSRRPITTELDSQDPEIFSEHTEESTLPEPTPTSLGKRHKEITAENQGNAPQTAVKPSKPNANLKSTTQAAKRTSNAVKKSYGQSVQGRPLNAHIFGKGPENVYVLGAFHGDEGPAVSELVNDLIVDLAAKPQLIAGKRVICVPLVNPDGFALRTRQNARRVDINRNFDTPDFRVGKKDRYYGGQAPLSEPESRALSTLLQNYPPERILSIHAPLRMNNYDGPAGRLAQKMARLNGLPAKSDVGYKTPGSFGTKYGDLQNIPVITLEIGPNEAPQQAWNKYGASLLAFVEGA